MAQLKEQSHQGKEKINPGVADSLGTGSAFSGVDTDADHASAPSIIPDVRPHEGKVPGVLQLQPGALPKSGDLFPDSASVVSTDSPGTDVVPEEAGRHDTVHTPWQKIAALGDMADEQNRHALIAGTSQIRREQFSTLLSGGGLDNRVPLSDKPARMLASLFQRNTRNLWATADEIRVAVGNTEPFEAVRQKAMKELNSAGFGYQIIPIREPNAYVDMGKHFSSHPLFHGRDLPMADIRTIMAEKYILEAANMPYPGTRAGWSRETDRAASFDFYDLHPNRRIQIGVENALEGVQYTSVVNGSIMGRHFISGSERLLATMLYLQPDGGIPIAGESDPWFPVACSLDAQLSSLGYDMGVDMRNGSMQLVWRGKEVHPDEAWEKERGNPYAVPGKDTFIRHLSDLSQGGKLGTRVMDVGCGPNQVTTCITQGQGNTQRVLVDRVNWPHTDDDTFIVADAADASALENALADTASVDSAVLSSILNYVPFRETLPVIANKVAPGGRIVVFNAAEGGFRAFFHPTGRPHTATAIIRCLEGLGMEIEEATDLLAEKRGRAPHEESSYFIVARKQN